MRFRLHGMVVGSRANGPGQRAVVWFQGCRMGCPGCFNPASHDPLGGVESTTEEVWTKIAAGAGRLEGISFSGGEPLDQPEALLELARYGRQIGWSVLLFSGYSREFIEAMPLGPEILALTDVLVDGPYRQDLPCHRGLLSSTNQRLHLLSDRYGLSDFENLPQSEIFLHKDGSLTVSGIRPVSLTKVLAENPISPERGVTG